MGGGSVGCPARQVGHPSTPVPISSSPATAKLPPSICFLTSSLELDKAATSRTMNMSVISPLVETAKTYFEEVDAGRLPAELFAPDFEFYFPKFGVGRGLEEFRKCATGLAAAGHKLVHHCNGADDRLIHPR